MLAGRDYTIGEVLPLEPLDIPAADRRHQVGIFAECLLQTPPARLAADVEKRRKTMRINSFKPSEVKRLLNSPEEQLHELARLASPAEAPVSSEDLKEAHESSLDG